MVDNSQPDHPLVKKYDLTAHPEGGYYRQTYASEMMLTSPAHGLERPALTHIYFLLLEGQVSRFHRVLHDEVWNFYGGAPLRLLLLQDGMLEERILGGPEGEYSAVVPAGCYQAAESTGDHSLVGCTVAPGFDFNDFTFMDLPMEIDMVRKVYPQVARFL